MVDFELFKEQGRMGDYYYRSAIVGVKRPQTNHRMAVVAMRSEKYVGFFVASRSVCDSILIVAESTVFVSFVNTNDTVESSSSSVSKLIDGSQHSSVVNPPPPCDGLALLFFSLVRFGVVPSRSIECFEPLSIA